MVVRVQSSGHRTLGLLLHGADVRRYFPERLRFIELQLGDLCIGCKLEPEFWRSHPVIADPRLCAWLDFKVFHEPARRVPPPMELIPIGRNRFVLSYLSASNVSTYILPEETAPEPIAVNTQPNYSPQRRNNLFELPPVDESAILVGSLASRNNRNGDSDEIDWTSHDAGKTSRWGSQRDSRSGVGG